MSRTYLRPPDASIVRPCVAMRFSVRAFTGQDADAVAGWRYPALYDVYDASEDPSFEEGMRDPERWGELEFAVDDAESGELAGSSN